MFLHVRSSRLLNVRVCLLSPRPAPPAKTFGGNVERAALYFFPPSGRRRHPYARSINHQFHSNQFISPSSLSSPLLPPAPMEVLQSGNAPALVTNLEVMQLLQERIAARQQQQQSQTPSGGGATDESNSTNRNSAFQNRDWIEQTVLNHLQSSPVGGINVESLQNIPTLVEQLRRAPTTSNAASSIGVQVSSPTDEQQEQLSGYGLTNIEILQLLNHLPTSLVELHLLIDDLEKREHLDEEEKQMELLQLISQFAGKTDEGIE